MALIYCKDCGKQISDAAVACPHCGCPVEKVKTFKCPECGIDVKEGTASCPNCGFPFQKKPEPDPILSAIKIETPQPYKQTYQQSYQQPYQQPYQQDIDEPNAGFKVLSLFVPMAGWSLAAKMAREGRPNCQAAYFKNANIGMGAIWGGMSALMFLASITE